MTVRSCLTAKDPIDQNEGNEEGTVESTEPIVIGFDHSDCSLAALKWAGHLAERSGATVKVIHASEAVTDARDPIYASPSTTAQEHEYAQRVARKGKELLSTEHPALEVDAVGSIFGATAALDEASRSASCVVVGNHGQGRLKAVMLGSTAYALSGNAQCPVIVVRDEQTPLPGTDHPVVMGSDGSTEAKHALNAAADVAAQWQAPLLVVSAWMPPPPDPWEHPPFGYRSVAACRKARHEKARHTSLESVEHIRTAHNNVSVHGLVVEARPDDAVMNASPDASMLVLGSRGHGLLMGTLLGSTARSVLHQSTKPVMIVH